MFGYVMINKNEMKFKEFDIYHAYYCGLCKTLKDNYGRPGQFSLNYDMTFVILLLSGLYEPVSQHSQTKCIAHPLKKHDCIVNSYTEYAADMNILLTYYKCKDDWEDEGKKSRWLYAGLLKKKLDAVSQKYPQKASAIEMKLRELNENEAKGNTDIDFMAGLFGEIMAEVIVFQEDEWAASLYRLGIYLGKFIFLVDAYEDLEKDVKSNSYNPFLKMYQNENFETECKTILTMLIAECSKEFEKLPIIEHAAILRNILYSGVWYRYELIDIERREGKEKQNG